MNYKIFISIPMHNVPDSEMLTNLEKAREEAKKVFAKRFLCDEDDISCIDNFHCPLPDIAIKNPRVYLLGRAISMISNCDGVYFADGWYTAKGCKMERAINKTYGIPSMYHSQLSKLTNQFEGEENEK